MAEPASRRMEALRRHLLPPTTPAPPVLLPYSSSSVAIMEPCPVIIGGMVLDIHAKPSVAPQPGTTVPGMVKYIKGGVARNIAECMSKIGTRPFLISVVGNDMAGTIQASFEEWCISQENIEVLKLRNAFNSAFFSHFYISDAPVILLIEGDFLLSHWRSSGLCTEGILQVNDVVTPVVSNTFDRSGELIAGVASVGAVETFLTPSWIYRFRSQISSAPLLMVDANLPSESLKVACIMAYESGVPVFFEPVSVVKGQRFVPIAEYVACTTPNEIELIAMANALSPSVKYNFHKTDQCRDKAETVEYLFEMLRPAMFFLLEKGIKLLIVTLGSNGVFICCKRHINVKNNRHKCKQTPFSTELLENLDGCFSSETHVNLYRESSSRTCVFHLPAISASVVSLVGAGDCLVAGVLSALCGGLEFMASVAVGVAIAKASVESETNIPDSISAASVADDARRILMSAKRLW